MTIDRLTAGVDVADDVRNFAHAPGTEVIFGAGAIRRLPEICREHGGTRVLIVSDPGIAKAGHSGRAKDLLESTGLFADIFSDVHENPTSEDVYRCVEFARESRIDMIVGLGGGSSMDTGKGCNFILTNGGHMRDYWGIDKAEKPMLPFIAVPTTGGTGSECQSFALIADRETHMKMACGDKKAAARAAILDPELTITQPRAVTAHTGIDAFTHAIETAVTKKRTATSFAYSKLAFHLLNESFERVLASPEDIEARSMMQLGAAYAGTAIENSMLGAAHACANPLSARFNVVHGEAVGLMMPHVVRFNAQDDEISGQYSEFFAGDLPARMTELLAVAGMPTELKAYTIAEEAIPALAACAAAQWTAQFNPREVGEEELAGLYRAAM